MAQSSGSVSDGTGGQVLGGLNDELKALFSNNEGAGQPDNAVVGMLWFDPSEGLTGRLKICYSGTAENANFAILPFDPASGNLFGSVEIANASDLSGVTDRDLATIANDGGNVNTGTIGSIATSAAIRNYVDATNTHGEVADNTTNGHNLAANKHGVGAGNDIVGTGTTQTISNKTLTSPVINTQVTGTAILDEDTLASDSNTQLATQQSIKAYVDGQVGGVDLDFDTDTATPSAVDLDSQTLSILGGTGIGVTHSGQTITASIDSTVATLTGSQNLTNKTYNGGSIGATTPITSLSVDSINLNGNTISTADTDGNLILSPNGTGDVLIGTGTDARDLTVHGDLTVQGTNTTINTASLVVEDKNLVIANIATPVARTNSAYSGAGITVNTTGTKPSILWDNTNEDWDFSDDVKATSFKVGNSTVIDTSGEIAGTKISAGALDSDVKVNNANWSGTDLSVANGGTGGSSFVDGGIMLGEGTAALTSMARLTDGQVLVGRTVGNPDPLSGDTLRTKLGLKIGTNVQAQDAGLADIAGLAVTNSNFIVGDGTNWVAETGATARDSLDLGQSDTPQFASISINNQDTTVTRASAGDLNVEGNIVYRAGGTDVPVTDGGTGLSAIGVGNMLYADSANTLSELDLGSAFSVDTSGSTDVLNVDVSELSSVAVTDTGASNGQHLVRTGTNAGGWTDLIVDSADIVAGAVDFDRIQDVSGLGIVGRNASGTGDLSFLTGAQALSITGVPTLPSTIADDTSKNYVLRLTDVSGTETLTWNEQEGAYTHPTYTARTVDADTGVLSGASVVSDVDINFTSDAEGHVTVANTTVATRTLTATDIGAAATSHTHAGTDLTDLRFHIDTTNKTLELRSGGTAGTGTELASVSIADLISAIDVNDWT